MTEKEIIAGCLKKHTESEYALFKMFAPRLMSVCLRYAGTNEEAEEALQESFLKIFSAIHQFRFEGSFEGWLQKVYVSVCLRMLQRKKIRYDELPAHETATDVTQPTALSALSEKELITLISQLPRGYRLVFNLYIIEGYTHPEIARLLGIDEATSRSQLIKARRRLQKQIVAHQKMSL